MLVALAFLFLVTALARLQLTALLWLPALFCAVAAMHWIAALHHPDPLMSLYGFVGAGLGVRIALELAVGWCVASLTSAAGCRRTRARR